jgi:CHC2 zinc finger
MRIERLAERLNAKSTGDGRWMAKCPAHDDRTPSLSLRRGRDGRNLWHCFGAGCAPHDIARAIAVPVEELLRDTPAPPGRPRPARPETIAERTLAIALEQRWVEALPEYEVADAIRCAHVLVGQGRHWANDLWGGGATGPVKSVWERLQAAARLEIEAFALEAML